MLSMGDKQNGRTITHDLFQGSRNQNLGKKDRNFRIIYPHIATVVIGHDGSVYMREILDDPQGNGMDNEMGSGVFHNWAEFKTMDTVNFHPAAMIEEWAKKEHISLAWLRVDQT